MNVVFIEHNNQSGTYLFEVPEGVKLGGGRNRYGFCITPDCRLSANSQHQRRKRRGSFTKLCIAFGISSEMRRVIHGIMRETICLCGGNDDGNV